VTLPPTTENAPAADGSARAEARVWLELAYADKDMAKALGAPVGRGRPPLVRANRSSRVEQLKAWAAAPALPDPLPGKTGRSVTDCSWT